MNRPKQLTAAALALLLAGAAPLAAADWWTDYEDGAYEAYDDQGLLDDDDADFSAFEEGTWDEDEGLVDDEQNEWFTDDEGFDQWAGDADEGWLDW